MRRLIKGLLVGLSFACLLAWNGPGASPQEATEKTDGSKYGKFVISKELYREIDHYTGTSLYSGKGELKANVSFGYHCISEPITFDKPHSHDFHEILCFIGGNPQDITDFGAEVEYTMGDEKHIINGPTCVSMPAGLQHCPIVVKNVEKPIVFIEISLVAKK